MIISTCYPHKTPSTLLFWAFFLELFLTISSNFWQTTSWAIHFFTGFTKFLCWKRSKCLLLAAQISL